MPTQRPKVGIRFQDADMGGAQDELRAHHEPQATVHLAPAGQRILLGLALVVLAIASAVPAASGKFILNDDLNVTNNAALRSWRGLVPIWAMAQRMPQIQPFTYTALLAQHMAFRDSPFGYHVVN